MMHVPVKESFPLSDNLDRGVLLAAIIGVVANGLQSSLSGVLLTFIAAACYGLARNRLANGRDFEMVAEPPPHPMVNVRHFRLLCLWLGSIHIYQGLLGDMVDIGPDSTEATARRYLRKTLWVTLWARSREKCLTLLWLNRFL